MKYWKIAERNLFSANKSHHFVSYCEDGLLDIAVQYKCNLRRANLMYISLTNLHSLYRERIHPFSHNAKYLPTSLPIPVIRIT